MKRFKNILIAVALVACILLGAYADGTDVVDNSDDIAAAQAQAVINAASRN